MTRKIAILGSSTFPLTAGIGAEIVEAMRAFGDDVVFLTRGSAGVDQFVQTAAMVMQRPCLMYRGAGGRDNLDRDDALVAACDELLAFLDPAILAVASNRTGTLGIVDRALVVGRPVRVATVADGQLAWVEEPAGAGL